MVELEVLNIGEAFRFCNRRYRVVRKWDGASIQAVSLDFRQEMLTLHYGADGHPTSSPTHKTVGLSYV